MALLRLENIGKIYTQESAVAVGIRGVNLSFDIGEFVAITGKSGCGKTTLLNVISGQDTYEEGELYVQDHPTSHYLQKDWEEYRREYIAFVFQDYNIIESFTVLQNVELALTRITDRKQRRKRALELIDKVGMTPFLKHKGSHLSGGQKQRTVIARALAKDSPIILADEPTGNLDSQSAKEIVKLLAEVAKDKLMIVVTHDYEDVADYATRHIRIYDGAVESDEVIRSGVQKDAAVKTPKRWNARRKLTEGIVLGMHRFIAKPKLAILMTCVMLFSCIALMMLTSLCNQWSLPETYGNHSAIFQYQNGRLIVCRQDSESMTSEDIERLQGLEGVNSVFAGDKYLDYNIEFHPVGYDYYTSFESYLTVSQNFGKPTWGKAPEKVGEVMFELPIYYKNKWEGLGELQAILENNIKMPGIRCTGVRFFYDNRQSNRVLMSEETYRTIYPYLNLYATSLYLKTEDTEERNIYYTVKVDDDLPIDQIKLRYSQSDAEKVENIDSGMIMEPGRELLQVTVAEKIKIDDGQLWGVQLIVSKLLVERFFSEVDQTRVSVYFEDDAAATNAIGGMSDAGYIAVPSNASVSFHDDMAFMIMSVFSKILWVLFVILISVMAALVLGKAILSTREDIAVFRSMGIDDGCVKISQYVQLVLSFVPAFVGMLAFTPALFMTAASEFFLFLGFGSYCLIFFGGLAISLLTAHRLNRSMYRKTVRKNLGRESK